MNTKYLVIADTYPYGYGAEYHLFGIYDTEKEAINFIINNPKIKIGEAFGYDDKPIDIIFDFFKYYQSTNVNNITKENYISRYIKKFDGNPTYIGGYVE